MKKKWNGTKIVLTVIFWVIGLSMLVPLLWMISTACKMEADVFNFPIQWIPPRWNLKENMKEVWGGTYNFGLYYLNSIKVTVGATILQVFVSALGAYGFSKVHFKGRDKIFLAYLATMMIPPQVTIVSQFIITREIGLYNSHTGLVLMLAFSVYGVFLLRQAMLAIPESLSESAKIDGAGHVTIFFQIILPMVKPSLATLATLKFVWTWNDYFGPAIFLNDQKKYTLSVGLVFLSKSINGYKDALDQGPVMAMSLLTVLPIMILYSCFQKYFIKGIVDSGLKG